DRGAYAYRDMDFYDDRGQSAYRPWMTVDELRKRENFLYRNNVLVTRFEETPDAVRVHGIDTAAGEAVSLVCRRLVLAPGVLGSARIVLRSFDRNPELPILCNPYCYLACIQPALLGAPARGRQVGFSRSEERRVGKECRSRRRTDHIKKKIDKECMKSNVT